MADLWLGVVLNLTVSFACGFAVRQLSRQWPLRWVDVAGVVLGVALVLYIAFVWDQWWLATILPFSNLIMLGNGLPIFAAVLIGLTCRRVRGRRRTRSVAVMLLTLTGVVALLRPLLGQTPVCEVLWDGEVCLQTTPHTCSAASAATVLRSVGVDTCESEMARLCLTRQGTHWMGLYRGLKLKLSQGWQIAMLQAVSPDALRAVSQDTPALLTVELPRDVPAAWKYRQESGWLPGVSHTVVCFGPDGDDHWWIADPANGLERWSTADLLVLWQGRGIRLTRR